MFAARKWKYYKKTLKGIRFSIIDRKFILLHWILNCLGLYNKHFIRNSSLRSLVKYLFLPLEDKTHIFAPPCNNSAYKTWYIHKINIDKFEILAT